MQNLPPHLKQYIVDQNYNKYTYRDHAVWRCTLRQLKSFLFQNAHSCYASGLEKTGISTDCIPRISDISEHLKNYGWQAVPVSGFIPPAAFMELQALGFLPIASEIRSLDQITYTPAPDIIHEAAGHAPILIDPHFSEYLQNYAQVASKAIINKEDIKLYQAIRILSDLKESATSSPKNINQAEKNLKQATDQMKQPSEAALLARMNWWTAEYGLIGDLKSPKIYGAGLLSSLFESQHALTPQVKKISFSLECLNYSYDITKPQQQLFVVESFPSLSQALKDMEKTMAFYQGGTYGLKLAKRSQTVNTLEYNSGLQVAGILSDYKEQKAQPIYINLQGPVQLCYQGKVIPGHDKKRHPQGFGSPIGQVKNFNKCLSQASQTELERLGFKVKDEGPLLQGLQIKYLTGHRVHLSFQSGVEVKGRAISMHCKDYTPLIITFKDCQVSYKEEVLFHLDWGEFDMAVGDSIVSVFSGPSDRKAYGPIDSFVSSKKPSFIQAVDHSKAKTLENLYAKVRHLRQENPTKLHLFKNVLDALEDFPDEWLLRLEILEASYHEGLPEVSCSWQEDLKMKLKELIQTNEQHAKMIRNGCRMALNK